MKRWRTPLKMGGSSLLDFLKRWPSKVEVAIRHGEHFVRLSGAREEGRSNNLSDSSEGDYGEESDGGW